MIAGLLCVSLGAPQFARAQDAKSVAPNVTVKLDAENASLYSVLRTLFNQANVDFTVAESLKSIPVTVRLRQPFRVALETVLKTAGQPLAYDAANGIYHIVPATEKPSTLDDEAFVPEEPLMPKIFKPYFVTRRMRNLNGVDMVYMLGGVVLHWFFSTWERVGPGSERWGNPSGMMGEYATPISQSMGTGGFSPFGQDGYGSRP